MSDESTAERVSAALDHAHLSQRAVADGTGIPQATLSRIITGQRKATVPELLLIADATGHSFDQLTGAGISEEDVQWSARATNGSDMSAMKAAILRFMDLNAYLDSQAIPGTS